jgi:ATP synthase protein I
MNQNTNATRSLRARPGFARSTKAPYISCVRMTPWKDYGRYGSVGIDLILSMAVGYYGGRWIDARVGAHGWITLAGFLAGLGVGFRTIFRAGKHMQRDIERAELREHGGDPWADERDLTAPKKDGEDPSGGGPP